MSSEIGLSIKNKSDIDLVYNFIKDKDFRVYIEKTQSNDSGLFPDILIESKVFSFPDLPDEKPKAMNHSMTTFYLLIDHISRHYGKTVYFPEFKHTATFYFSDGTLYLDKKIPDMRDLFRFKNDTFLQCSNEECNQDGEVIFNDPDLFYCSQSMMYALKQKIPDYQQYISDFISLEQRLDLRRTIHTQVNNTDIARL